MVTAGFMVFIFKSLAGCHAFIHSPSPKSRTSSAHDPFSFFSGGDAFGSPNVVPNP